MATIPQALSRAEIRRAFALLEALLDVNPLPCADGTYRVADVSEFMLMHTMENQGAAFKHRQTRNYVHVVTTCYGIPTLHVPITDQPFNRGVFDYD